jgi:hypothetical protein
MTPLAYISLEGVRKVLPRGENVGERGRDAP